MTAAGKAWAQRAALAAGAIAIAAQFYQPDFTNPPADPSRYALANHAAAGNAQVGAILERACADCHSHQTQWPWYSRISPVSWTIQRHVEQGREKMNFSEWTGWSQDQKEEILDSVEKGKMPLARYTLMHPDARLSDQDRATLRSWARGERAQK